MTDVRAVRVRLVWSDADSRDEELDDQILIDLTINADGKSVGLMPAFGIYGSPERVEVYPFILRMDGTVDYGNNSEVGDRFHEFNIRARPVKVGEYATYVDGNETWNYRIISVLDAATGLRV